MRSLEFCHGHDQNFDHLTMAPEYRENGLKIWLTYNPPPPISTTPLTSIHISVYCDKVVARALWKL